MMAFLKFEEDKVDYAVLEAGIGGRLDATNIVIPELSCIASVGWDHMESLGDTLEKIATEKAGIIKEGVPIVIGPETPLDVFSKVAASRNSKLV